MDNYDILDIGDEAEAYAVFLKKRDYVYFLDREVWGAEVVSSEKYYINKITREPEIELKPDLIIEEISWSPSSPEQGNSITFTVTIKNQGTGDATFFHVYYYIDDSYSDMDNIYRLPAGSTIRQNFTWTANKCGDVQVKAVADAGGDRLSG